MMASKGTMVGVICLVGIGGMFGRYSAHTEPKTIIIREHPAPKVITKTKTEVKTVTKRVAYFPPSCLEAMNKFHDFNKSVTQYEQGIGGFESIVNESIKDISQKNMSGLNDQAGALAQVKIKTSPALQAMMRDKKEIDDNTILCKEELQ
jgi:hypothetical protein